MTTTTAFTPQQKLTVIKHLAGGKPVEMVATIMHTTKDTVLDVAKNHGYPDRAKLAWAADVMAKNIETDTALPERPLTTGEPMRPRGEAVTSPAGPPTPHTTPLTRPDELRVLLNTAKAHPSKRIQAAADRVFDQLNKLQTLIRDDEQKNAAKRRADAEKAAARAEVKRLEAQLAEAKAKLRPSTSPVASSSTSPAAPSDGEPTAKEIRAWAKTNKVACPEVGRVPASVREAYLEATSEAAAS